MKYAVNMVPYGSLSYFIAQLVPNLYKSELWTRGRASVDDIVRFLFTQQMQLWIVHDPEEQKVHGYVITELKLYPKCKMLVVQYCAGDYGSLDASGDVTFAELDKFAKAEGCSGIEFFGRPGWKNYARKNGYHVQTVVYEKYFNEVQP